MEVKPRYKQTEVGVIPAEWQCAQMSSIARLESGHTPSKREPSYWGGSVPWVSLHDTESLDGREILTTAQTITEEGLNNSSARLLPKGTVVFSRTATVGKTTTLGREMATSQDFAAYICGPQINNHFLVYLFRSIGRTWRSLMAGSIHNTIYMPVFKALKIALPPLPEQRAIAEALSDVDRLLDGLNRLISKKRDLKRAAMQQLLTGQTRLSGFHGEWPVRMFADMFSFSGGYSASRAQLSSSGHCYLHYGDIHGAKKTTIDVRADHANIPKLDVPLNRVPSKSLLEDGDVVFVDASEDEEGTSRHVVVVNKEKKPFISGLHTIVAKSKTDELAHDYRRYCFQTAAVRQQFLFYSVGTKVSGISKTNIAKLKMAVPSVPEQAAIAEVLSDIDAELAALEQRRQKTHALKQAMMQELLTGRIRLVANSSNATVLPFVDSASPAEPKPQKPAHSWAFNEAVVIAVLAAEFGSTQFPLGRMRYTKLAYLLHRHAEHIAEGYLKKAAGPYNPATRYAGPEKIACESSYVKRHKRDQFEGFIAGEKNAQARAYFLEWYGQSALDWLQQFRFWKKEELERVATVDMAMEELRRANRDVTVETVKEVIARSPDWLPKLDRAVFADAHLDTAIKQCRSLFQV